MSNYQIFLREGKWFGNIFPEKPQKGDYWNAPEGEENAVTEKYNDTVEKLKAEALEVVNPEETFCCYLENRWINQKTGQYIVDGVLYPWDGGWEIGCGWSPGISAEFCSRCMGNCPDKVLRLLPKSPVKDKHEIWNGEWIQVGKDAYLHGINNNRYGRINGVLQHGDPEQKKGGIAVIGVPEYGELEPSSRHECHEHTEGFEWLIETNELIKDATQTLFEDNGKAEEGICLVTPHGDIALTVSELKRIIKEVAPVNDAGGGKEEPNDRDWKWYLKGLSEGYGQAEFEGHKRPVHWPPIKGTEPSPQAESQEDQSEIWGSIISDGRLYDGTPAGFRFMMERFTDRYIIKRRNP
jgi:hypothetical protein